MMYVRNNNRPKMLPCGTPKVTGRASDNLFSPEVSAVPDCSSTKKTTAKTRGETPTDDNWTSRSHDQLYRTPL